MADEPSRRDEILDELMDRVLAWGHLFRAVGVAIDARKLILAVLGLLVFHLGRAGLDQLFPAPAPVPAGVVQGLAKPSALPFVASTASLEAGLRSAPWRLTEPARLLVEPFVGIFALDSRWTGLLHAVLAAVWGALVWGFFGGAIARISVVQVARGERVSIGEALGFAWQKWLPLVGTPLCPLLGVGFFTALCAGFGLVYWIPASVGSIVAGVLAVFPLLAGLVMTIVLLSLAVGWPLMIATVAAEGEDGFDSLSRSFAYVNQRPGRYAAGTALAWGLGILGLVVVDLFANTTVHLTHWALSFGAPDDLLNALFQPGTGTAPVEAAGAGAGLASRVHAFWLQGVALVAHGWIYSFFWTAATIVYLLLRQDVDGTPWHAILPPQRRDLPFDSEPAPEPQASSDPAPDPDPAIPGFEPPTAEASASASTSIAPDPAAL
jgi:hypothetical protein